MESCYRNISDICIVLKIFLTFEKKNSKTWKSRNKSYVFQRDDKFTHFFQNISVGNTEKF